MTEQLSYRTALLAILSDIAYQAEPKLVGSRSTSSERVTNALKKAAVKYPHLGFKDLELAHCDTECFVVVNHNIKDVYISFRGTNVSNVEDLRNDVQIALGHIHDRVQIADNLTKKMIQRFGKYKVNLTGHSLGGTTAEHTCRKNPGTICETFNKGWSPFQNLSDIHKAFKGLFDLNKLMEHIQPALGDNIVNHVMKGDPISDIYGMTTVKKWQPGPGITGMKAHPLENFLKMIPPSLDGRIEPNQDLIEEIQSGNLIEEVNLENFYKNISGIYIDDNIYLTLHEKSSFPHNLGVELKDLASALLVFYDGSIKCKKICFSLDPVDKKNLDGNYQKKVFWPDKEAGRSILSSTEFGEILFEADWVMKQLSLGIEVNSLKPYQDTEMVYSQSLTSLGIKPSYLFTSGNQLTDCSDWCHLWLVVKKVVIKRLPDVEKRNSYEKCFIVDDIIMGVEARQVEADSSGVLDDKVVQDTNHRFYKFAQLFTQHYDKIAQEFPIFNKLKQTAKAIAIGQWMWVNKIPVDLEAVSKWHNSQKIDNYLEVVPCLKRTKESVTYSRECKQISTFRVFGGVNLMVDNWDLMEEEAKQYCSNPPKKSINKTHIYTLNVDRKELLKIEKVPNPLRPCLECVVCSCKLDIYECSVPYEEIYFCRNDHPMKCVICGRIVINTKSVESKKGVYHEDCLKPTKSIVDCKVQSNLSEITLNQMH